VLAVLITTLPVATEMISPPAPPLMVSAPPVIESVPEPAVMESAPAPPVMVATEAPAELMIAAEVIPDALTTADAPFTSSVADVA